MQAYLDRLQPSPSGKGSLRRLQLFNFRLSGGDFCFQPGDFSRLVILLLRPGELLFQLLDPLSEGFNFLLGLLVHAAGFRGGTVICVDLH